MNTTTGSAVRRRRAEAFQLQECSQQDGVEFSSCRGSRLVQRAQRVVVLDVSWSDIIA